ncbi:MarR family winged helix-turn-helix transcriptional regulator [Shewanella psychrotolerans]|uniref:MarR family winged helix-turn-helix transcriptional regulator n=1 Tax=Shewanella psychrotolerans TaxID=2864206 RepID=UPI001C656F88|nr:MarR family transcriptional regulator [Shewanella psychrotolerans]QYK01034.1 MarR family transcriptional regulator [Shewanella psychrotolerans]
MNPIQDDVDNLVAQWAKEKPQLDTLPMAILGRMMRLFKHIEADISACHKKFGLTMGEFDVLATIRRSGKPYSLTPSDLLSSMMLTSGAMTNRIDKLESKGLIVRTHCTQDRRSVKVALSVEGLAVIDTVIEAHVAIQLKLTQGLSAEDKVLLNSLFKQWLRQFES